MKTLMMIRRMKEVLTWVWIAVIGTAICLNVCAPVSYTHLFTIRVPLEVTYKWGTIYTEVDLNINKTIQN